MDAQSRSRGDQQFRFFKITLFGTHSELVSEAEVSHLKFIQLHRYVHVFLTKKNFYLVKVDFQCKIFVHDFILPQ